MKILAFSDLHCDLGAIEQLAGSIRGIDLLVGAGDYANCRTGLAPVVDAIGRLELPTLLVHGNSESEDELRGACRGYPHMNVLHGGSREFDGVTFFGLGAAVPETPFGSWSVDLSEREAWSLLRGCPRGAVLVSHSPPKGYCDRSSSGASLGSKSVLKCVKRCSPRYVLCGHIHASWGCSSAIADCKVFNLGPVGMTLDLV